MRIGEVHRILRSEFPDIELSTIRYYEDQGLVKPARTKSGYRQYGERDVECLREAFRLAQREQLRLAQIRLRLIATGLLAESGVTRAVTKAAARTAVAPVVQLDAPVAIRTAPPVVAPVVPVRPDAVAGLAELARAAGVDVSVCSQAISAGLVRPNEIAGVAHFSCDDVTVVTITGRLLARGADLRVVAATRRAVEREVGIIREIGQTMGDDAPSQSEIAREWSQMRDALFTRAIESPAH